MRLLQSWRTGSRNFESKVRGYLSRFRSLWALSAGLFVSSLGFALSIPFISIYFHSRLGLSLTEIGVFFGIVAVIRGVFQISGGELSDYVERRLVLIYAQVLRAASFLFIGLAIYADWGFWVIAAGFLFSSILGSVFYLTANAMVADVLPAEARLDGYAVARSAENLGWALGPAIGGFLAEGSYGLLFAVSGVITLASGIVFRLFFFPPRNIPRSDPFTFSDLLSARNNPYLVAHCLLAFLLYLVVAQLIAPFSVYTVEMAGIGKNELGFLYLLNGLMIVFLQVPFTRLLSRFRLATQMALGAFLYACGYGMLGLHTGFSYFALAIFVVTLGEIFISPPSLALISGLAPPGRMGQYMGIFGFFLNSGWSLGPVYGGVVLDYFSGNPAAAWAVISSLAAFSGIGYLVFARFLPGRFNGGNA
ncbi:MAG TPA: MFS transporter [Thermodesulfobacteriota bacterium]|nr:MFS transporter [Thermodesulfobacteriota bacterium]